MNPRGYTGAAEAYIGLSRFDNAADVLRLGLERTGNDEIRAMLYELEELMEMQSIQENNENVLELANDSEREQHSLSPSEIAESEPWGLFASPLQADELIFAGVPFWNVTLDAVMNAYPGGALSTDPESGIYYSGDVWYQSSYHGIDFAIDEQMMTALFFDNAGFRNLYMGMSLTEALSVLGFSDEGVSFVEEIDGTMKFIDFNMHGGSCVSVDVRNHPEHDMVLTFIYREMPNFTWMGFWMVFNGRSLTGMGLTAENF
jgi:hypothetical protein